MSAPDFSAERLPSLPRKPFVLDTVRPGATRAVTFTAWRLRDTCTAQPIALRPCDTLDEAISAAMPSLGHKDRLFILHTDHGRGEAFQHGWTVRRKAQARYVRGNDGLSHPVHDLDLADHFMLAVDAFEPKPPFDAFRDNASGRDLQLVEGGR